MCESQQLPNGNYQRGFKLQLHFNEINLMESKKNKFCFNTKEIVQKGTKEESQKQNKLTGK